MKTSFHNQEDILFNIYLSGPYENFRVEEISMKDPDGDTWWFEDNDKLLKDLVSDEDIFQLADDNAYELDMDHYLSEADRLHDMMKDGDL